MTYPKPTYPDIQSLSLKKLREYAKEKGLRGYSSLDRGLLINKLRSWIIVNEGFDPLERIEQ